MKDMTEEYEIEARLWNYIDGNVDAKEKTQIENLLQTNARWKQLYDELLRMHQLMNNDLELDEPSMRFTKNVMEEISKVKVAPATKSYINKKIINTIAAFFLVLIAGFMVYMFTQVKLSDTGSIAMPMSDLSKFDISKYLNKQFLN